MEKMRERREEKSEGAATEAEGSWEREEENLWNVLTKEETLARELAIELVAPPNEFLL